MFIKPVRKPYYGLNASYSVRYLCVREEKLLRYGWEVVRALLDISFVCEMTVLAEILMGLTDVKLMDSNVHWK